MKKNISAPSVAQVISWLIHIRLRSLHVRIALWALLLLCITQVVMSLILYSAISEWLNRQINTNLQLTGTQVSSVIHDPEEYDIQIDMTEIQSQLVSGNNVAAQGFLQDQLFFVRLIDLKVSKVIASSETYNIALPQLQNEDMLFETLQFIHHEKSEPMRIYTLRLSYAPQLALQVGISLRDTFTLQESVLHLLLLLTLITGSLALAGGWFLAARALVPIRKVTQTAAEISGRDFSRRLDLTVSDIELEQLVYTFNSMLDRIEEAFQRQRQFTLDASHELRTPLAIMQTQLDVTLSQPRSINDYQSALINIRDEVFRMTKLAGTLLILARTDSQEIPLHLEKFDLSIMIEAVIEQFVGLAEEGDIDLIHTIDSNVIISGDEDRLIQVIVNLIENAIKFTPEHGMVKVSLIKENEFAAVSVSDTGVGISLSEQAHIFERFYRVDNARTRTRGGFGLGLAIVKHILDLHDATIIVNSIEGQGSQFEIIFPYNR